MDIKSWLELQNESDVQGIATEGVDGEAVNLTPEVVRKIAVSFVSWLLEKTGKSPELAKISIGRDSRISGTDLMAAFSLTFKLLFSCEKYTLLGKQF